VTGKLCDITDPTLPFLVLEVFFSFHAQSPAVQDERLFLLVALCGVLLSTVCIDWLEGPGSTGEEGKGAEKAEAGERGGIERVVEGDGEEGVRRAATETVTGGDELSEVDKASVRLSWMEI
jgi:hypothetical protein